MKTTILFFFAVFLMTGCKQTDREEKVNTDFETMIVTKSNIHLEETFPASIEGRQSVKIIPRVEGYLCETKVKEGQQVKRGQVLFVIDQSSYQAEVKAAEANLAVAKANLANAQLNYDGSKQLNTHHVVSDHELKTTATNLAIARAQTQQAQALLESARANLSYTVLRSPSNGVIGSLPYRTGDFVGPTIQGGLTTVADSHVMHVYFSLTEREIMSRIAQQGSLDKVVSAFPSVSLQLADGSTYSVKGRIESISGVVESTTGATQACAVFSNIDGRLLSGSTGYIVIPNELKQVIVIPQSATYEIQDKTYAWRIVDGQAQSTIITVLPTSDGKSYVVTSGLSVGDVIVAKGAGYVKEGQGIEVK